MQYRQPRLADVIAGVLRERILAGELGDGEMLPRQEELLAEFGVSPPSLRGALQVLETEGLVTVLRGSVGGAMVHAPQARGVAYNTALVLQAQGTALLDVAVAMEELEPLCVRLCALRPDREETVVPVLRSILAETRAVLHDLDAAALVARRFHEQLVSLCGNGTLRVLAGSVETLWSAHEQHWVAEMGRRGDAPDVDERAGRVDAHEAIVDAIAAGDADRAGRLAGEHLRATRLYAMASPSSAVQAALLRE